jgi:hypothetical protein
LGSQSLTNQRKVILKAEFSFQMVPNGSSIAAVGDFENRQPNLALKFHRSTTVEVCLSAPIVAIPC